MSELLGWVTRNTHPINKFPYTRDYVIFTSPPITSLYIYLHQLASYHNNLTIEI
jgi:hypothetical protein